MICTESDQSVLHRYWLDIRARPSRMTLDVKAIGGRCNSSKVANEDRLYKFSNPNSVSSSLSRGVRYQGRYTSFFSTACGMTFGAWFV
jgi:hypothetical protein